MELLVDSDVLVVDESLEDFDELEESLVDESDDEEEELTLSLDSFVRRGIVALPLDSLRESVR